HHQETEGQDELPASGELGQPIGQATTESDLLVDLFVHIVGDGVAAQITNQLLGFGRQQVVESVDFVDQFLNAGVSVVGWRNGKAFQQQVVVHCLFLRCSDRQHDTSPRCDLR